MWVNELLLNTFSYIVMVEELHHSLPTLLPQVPVKKMGYKLLCLSLVLLLSLRPSSSQHSSLPLRAVNLGNWLITEGWMKPSLFNGIINKDLLDGTQVQLMSTKLQKYLCSENGGGTTLVANRSSASGWETFRLWRVNESSFNFRVSNNQFVGLENQGSGNMLVANSDLPSDLETFQIIRSEDDPTLIRIRGPNGLFLQTISDEVVSADYEGSGWEDDNPSVFKMTILRDKTIKGEYQITNGYGPDRAPQIMRDHWNTYITEEDFKFMSENGINAVRIPVGWWIAFDPTPPKPFVGGSLEALDNAFTWAQEYGMKVIVDLHAAPGSQNGNPHSATRDGSREWGDSYIPQTVSVIDFLAARYGESSSLAAIALMNEPMGVNLESLKNYYEAGYEAVRKHSGSAYVIMSSPLDKSPKELLSFIGGFEGAAIDVHYYNLFSSSFSKMNAQQNIDFITKQRASDIGSLTSANGPLLFVGEWSGEWLARGASKEERQRFVKEQVQVYSRASFGWAYWAYKCDSDYWSLQWLIQNNFIKL